MPDRRAHRGPHPEDGVLFSPDTLIKLQSATADLCWLLTRHYAQPSALKIVGDRYDLIARQRMAIMRSACSDQARAMRRSHQVLTEGVEGQPILIDGYNVLTTLEAALAGAVILQARDGCFRDIASMHGTYRRVEETLPALRLVAQTLGGLGVPQCTWYLDSPVSNSGRLKSILMQCALEHQWNWQVELVQSPDAILAKSVHIIATADSAILDAGPRWFNLARQVVQKCVLTARVLDLSGDELDLNARSNS